MIQYIRLASSSYTSGSVTIPSADNGACKRINRWNGAMKREKTQQVTLLFSTISDEGTASMHKLCRFFQFSVSLATDQSVRFSLTASSTRHDSEMHHFPCMLHGSACDTFFCNDVIKSITGRRRPCILQRVWESRLSPNTQQWTFPTVKQETLCGNSVENRRENEQSKRGVTTVGRNPQPKRRNIFMIGKSLPYRSNLLYLDVTRERKVIVGMGGRHAKALFVQAGNAWHAFVMDHTRK